MIFTRDNILSRLREQPFTPMQIVTTTGQVYDIYHPEMVMALRNHVMIATSSPDEPSVPDRVTRVALVHVTELRDLPITPQTGANGVASG